MTITPDQTAKSITLQFTDDEWKDIQPSSLRILVDRWLKDSIDGSQRTIKTLVLGKIDKATRDELLAVKIALGL